MLSCSSAISLRGFAAGETADNRSCPYTARGWTAEEFSVFSSSFHFWCFKNLSFYLFFFYFSLSPFMLNSIWCKTEPCGASCLPFSDLCILVLDICQHWHVRSWFSSLVPVKTRIFWFSFLLLLFAWLAFSWMTSVAVFSLCGCINTHIDAEAFGSTLCLIRVRFSF